MTVRAVDLIRSADVVAYHCARHGRSNARAIAAQYLGTQVEEALTYPVTTESTDDYQGRIDAFYTEAAARLAAHLDAGRDVVVLAEGDPFFYGSYMHLHKRLAHRYVAEVVPGVTSVSAASAALGTPLVERDEVLTVLPGTLGEDELTRRLADTDAAAVMKLGRTFTGRPDGPASVGAGGRGAVRRAGEHDERAAGTARGHRPGSRCRTSRSGSCPRGCTSRRRRRRGRTGVAPWMPAKRRCLHPVAVNPLRRPARPAGSSPSSASAPAPATASPPRRPPLSPRRTTSSGTPPTSPACPRTPANGCTARTTRSSPSGPRSPSTSRAPGGGSRSSPRATRACSRWRPRSSRWRPRTTPRCPSASSPASPPPTRSPPGSARRWGTTSRRSASPTASSPGTSSSAGSPRSPRPTWSSRSTTRRAARAPGRSRRRARSC